MHRWPHSHRPQQICRTGRARVWRRVSLGYRPCTLFELSLALPDCVAPSCSPAPLLFLAPLSLCSLVVFRARVLTRCSPRFVVACHLRLARSLLNSSTQVGISVHAVPSIDDGKKMSLWPRHYHVSGKVKPLGQFGLADMSASSVVQCLQSKPGTEIAISCKNRHATCARIDHLHNSRLTLAIATG